LRRYVSDDLVDYAALKRGRPELDAYLRSLESVERSELEARPRPDQLAFWINAYNAYTVKLVLDHYPLRSIRSIGFLPGSAFKRKFIPFDRVAGGSCRSTTSSTASCASGSRTPHPLRDRVRIPEVPRPA
jgi:hypothetical protein